MPAIQAAGEGWDVTVITDASGGMSLEAYEVSIQRMIAARLSPFHFARMFRHSVGVPPRVYLTKLRLEKACELLEKTDLSVTEIAPGGWIFIEPGAGAGVHETRAHESDRLSPSGSRTAASHHAAVTSDHGSSAAKWTCRISLSIAPAIRSERPWKPSPSWLRIVEHPGAV